MAIEDNEHPIIIHPYPHAPQEYLDRWRKLSSRITSRTIHWFPGNPALDEADYLDDPERYPNDSVLILAGQMADACMKRKLRTLADHPRVKNGKLQVVVDRAGTMGNTVDEIDQVVAKINRERGVKFKIK